LLKKNDNNHIKFEGKIKTTSFEKFMNKHETINTNTTAKVMPPPSYHPVDKLCKRPSHALQIINS
jgi:hypothetical protein